VDTRWVRVPPGADLRRFPDFLIVGPQRTGTSWLYTHLRFHPEILFSRPKEIHFFSSLKSRDPRRFVTDDVGWYLDFFRDRPWMWALKNGVSLLRHGRRYDPRARGEATASYATLDPDVIDDIVRLNPAIRVVLMVRNPVDRAWSDAKYYFERRRRRLDELGEKELKEFLTDDYQRKCARYVACHDNWAGRLRPGHVLLGRFDDIATEPERMLRGVMRFIGVDDDPRYVASSVRAPVNTTSGSGVTDDYRRFLEELFRDDMRSLRDRFGIAWD
jgi:hypothetical protein